MKRIFFHVHSALKIYNFYDLNYGKQQHLKCFIKFYTKNKNNTIGIFIFKSNTKLAEA